MNGKLFLKSGEEDKIPSLLVVLLSALQPDQAIEIAVVPAIRATNGELDVAEISRARLWEQLDRSIERLELSIRAQNVLANAKILLIGELVQQSDAQILRLTNAGRRTLREFKELLSSMGLSLGMNVQGWTPRRAQKTE